MLTSITDDRTADRGAYSTALSINAVVVVLCVQVRYLKVIEKSGYQALPWVRYITTAGNYEIRMN